MKKLGFIALLPILLVVVGFYSKPAPSPTHSHEEGVVADSLVWMTFEEAMEANQKEPRKLFVDVYTSWCGWCKRMDQTTFSDEHVKAILAEKFYAIKFNAEQKEDIVMGEQTYKFVAQGARGYHELAAALLQGKMSYPTVVFLDEKFNMIQPLPGYRQAPELHQILSYIGNDHYVNTPYDEFSKTYTSPF